MVLKINVITKKFQRAVPSAEQENLYSSIHATWVQTLQPYWKKYLH